MIRLLNYFVIMAFFVMTVSFGFHSSMVHADTPQKALHDKTELLENCHHEGHQVEHSKAKMPQGDGSCCKAQCNCAITHCGAASHLLLAVTIQFAGFECARGTYVPYDEVAQSYIPDKFKRPPKA